MSKEELQPRSKVLREALGKAKDNGPAQALLTVAETCKHLRVSKTKLYELFQSGKLKSVTQGRRRFFTMRAIKQYIQQLEEDKEGLDHGN